MFGIIRTINNWMYAWTKGQVKQEQGKKRYKPFWKPSYGICVVPNLVMVKKSWMSWPSGRSFLVCEGRNLASEFFFFFAVEFNFDTVEERFRSAIYYKISEKKKKVNKLTDFKKKKCNFGLLPFCWEFFNNWELRTLPSLHLIVAYCKIKIVQRAQ